jgi:hypothetical protein
VNARLAILLTVASATAVLVVGCGGGGDSTSDSAGGGAESAAVSSFVKKANAACEKARGGGFGRVEAFLKKFRSQGLSQAELTLKATRAGTLATIEAETAGIRKLDAPAESDEEIKAIFASLQAALAEAKHGKRLLIKGMTPTDEVIARFKDADGKLKAYGLTKCIKTGEE